MSTNLSNSTTRPKSPFNYMYIHSYGSVSSTTNNNNSSSNLSSAPTATQKQATIMLSHGIGSSHHFSSAFSSTAVTRLPQDDTEDYQFGFIPNDIFQQLTDIEHYQKRLDAIEKVCFCRNNFLLDEIYDFFLFAAVSYCTTFPISTIQSETLSTSYFATIYWTI